MVHTKIFTKDLNDSGIELELVLLFNRSVFIETGTHTKPDENLL